MIKKIIASVALMSCAGIGIAQADDSNFVGASYGKTWSDVEHNNTAKQNLANYEIENVFNKDNNWGVRAGRYIGNTRFYINYDQTSGYSNGTKLRQQNIIGSADYIYPVAANTRLFAGASAGINRLSNGTSGYENDDSYGFTYGAQAGVIQSLDKNFEVEAGAKYFKNNNSVDYRNSEGKEGTAKLTANKEIYVAVNYKF